MGNSTFPICPGTPLMFSSLWLLDLLSDVPSTSRLDGFDISLDQCPPPPWLPSNVKLHTWNVFDDPPPDFVEVFDVVHVRLITFVIKNNDPRSVLSNLWKLLKPGGYLQWDEVDSVGCYVKAASPSISTDQIENLLKQLGGVDNWKDTMTGTLSQNGFEDAQLLRFDYSLMMARYWNDMYMSTWNEFAKTVLKTPIASAKLGFDALEQVRNGSAIICPKLVWVARKI
ncbi:MAG: hypothetical protein Q9213_007436 [Squamulea squamosa]